MCENAADPDWSAESLSSVIARRSGKIVSEVERKGWGGECEQV